VLCPLSPFLRVPGHLWREHQDCHIASAFEACMLLDVRDLKTYYYTAWIVRRSVTYTVRPGETVAW
jgi:hypothetical protein